MEKLTPRLVDIGPPAHDLGGILRSLESERVLGFPTRRVYWISGVPAGVKRGMHSHKALHQAILCLNGEVTVKVDSPVESWTFHLDNPQTALFLPPGFWRELDRFSPEALVLVLASAPYDAEDYIRSWPEYKAWFQAS